MPQSQKSGSKSFPSRIGMRQRLTSKVSKIGAKVTHITTLRIKSQKNTSHEIVSLSQEELDQSVPMAFGDVRHSPSVHKGLHTLKASVAAKVSMHEAAPSQMTENGDQFAATGTEPFSDPHSVRQQPPTPTITISPAGETSSTLDFFRKLPARVEIAHRRALSGIANQRISVKTFDPNEDDSTDDESIDSDAESIAFGSEAEEVQPWPTTFVFPPPVGVPFHRSHGTWHKVTQSDNSSLEIFHDAEEYLPSSPPPSQTPRPSRFHEHIPQILVNATKHTGGKKAALAPPAICDICMSLAVSGCIQCPEGHHWCFTCIRDAVTTALNDFEFAPPGCCATLPVAAIDEVMGPDMAKIYADKIKEYETPLKDRRYCHDPECNAFIAVEVRVNPPMEAECPCCGAMTCTRCGGKAHGICARFSIAEQTQMAAEEVVKAVDSRFFKKCPNPACLQVLGWSGEGCSTVCCQCGDSVKFDEDPVDFRTLGIFVADGAPRTGAGNGEVEED